MLWSCHCFSVQHSYLRCAATHTWSVQSHLPEVCTNTCVRSVHPTAVIYVQCTSDGSSLVSMCFEFRGNLRCAEHVLSHICHTIDMLDSMNNQEYRSSEIHPMLVFGIYGQHCQNLFHLVWCDTTPPTRGWAGLQETIARSHSFTTLYLTFLTMLNHKI